MQETSLTAYHENAAMLSESRMRVAREILRLTKVGQPAYISLVAKNLTLDKSSVSGRMNDLATKFPEGFMIDGRRYKMEPLKNRVFDPTSGKCGQYVNAWAIVLYQSPASAGEQTALFV